MLTPADLAELEATLLPALERHHLRLLAHALRTLQEITGEDPGRGPGQLPTAAAITAWAGRQPAIAGDPGFIQAFTDQMVHAGTQLEAIAAPAQRPALSLELADLIHWAEQQARQRISGPPPG